MGHREVEHPQEVVVADRPPPLERGEGAGGLDDGDVGPEPLDAELRAGDGDPHHRVLRHLHALERPPGFLDLPS